MQTAALGHRPLSTANPTGPVSTTATTAASTPTTTVSPTPTPPPAAAPVADEAGARPDTPTSQTEADANNGLAENLKQVLQKRASFESSTLRASNNNTADSAESSPKKSNGSTVDAANADEEDSGKADAKNLADSSPDLSGKLRELHDTLSKLKQESDDKIKQLKAESANASKTIEKLQQQLQQQSDYDLLKREIQLLKHQGVAAAVAAAANGDVPSAGQPANLEMLLALERAKVLQGSATPSSAGGGVAAALKAFSDMQGPAGVQFPGGPAGLGRHPLFPGAPSSPIPGANPAGITGLEAALGLGSLNEEMMAQWRRSMEQSGIALAPPSAAGAVPPVLGGAPVSPPRSTSPAVVAPSQGSPSQKSTRSPSNGRSPSPAGESNVAINGNGDIKIRSFAEDTSRTSPARPESKSPSIKPSESSPLPSPSPFGSNLSANPGIGLPLPLPLTCPPLMSTGRIPKSDPMEGRLQDMLRYNMEKYAGQALDTLGISRRVRELLSIHNIGQRLFAKYVLGLSQGTVSELLSKPKCWEKLTEKGRDSYRKMHAWAYDEQAVMLLKSLIPRKGELMRPVTTSPLIMRARPEMPPFPQPAIDPNQSNEDRFAKILSDANKALSKAASEETAPVPQAAGIEADNPQERMSKLYQEELARLMQQGSKNGGARPQDSLFQAGIFNQRAMDLYQQELNRLQQSAIAAAIRAQGKDDPKDSKDVKEEDSKAGLAEGDSKAPSTPSSQSSSVGKSPSGLFPNGEPGGSPASSAATTMADLASSLSPLQRMASITNSLVTHPPIPPQVGQSQRPTRPVLPPITQQQFDMFQHLNTDETVRKIKEILSQYSISQRLFGESVLGLSQGSVSDLLARPKPWHMLTQKGREPFIRMRLFLDDENAVHKLVASQYKIAPEKLMRTGSYAGSHLPINSKMPKLPDFPRAGAAFPGAGMDGAPSSAAALAARFSPAEAAAMAAAAAGVPGASMERAGPLLDPLALHRKLLSQKLPVSSAGGNGSLPGAPSPSLYEMAALTHELDTQAVTTKVKEILLANNVGQKLFGEAVLGLSQGSVSELLSKPKPWHMLSIKGREPFIRMQLWLTDPQSIEKLQALKNERREGAKKRRLGGSGFDSSSDRSSPADPSDFYGSADSPGGSAKKQRILFTDEQKEALKIAFALNPYPSSSVMDYLAQELNLETSTVSNWFHNHRMRLKQQLPGVDLSLIQREGAHQTFDTVKFKLLCHQKMLEMQQPGGSNNSSGDEGFGANSSVTSFLRQFGLNASALAATAAGAGNGEGLDLTFKSRDTDNDNDSIADSSHSAEQEHAEAASPPAAAAHMEKAAALAVLQAAASAAGGSRSRRKPVAPQWLRPEHKWPKESAMDEAGDDEAEAEAKGLNGLKDAEDRVSSPAAAKVESGECSA